MTQVTQVNHKPSASMNLNTEGAQVSISLEALTQVGALVEQAKATSWVGYWEDVNPRDKKKVADACDELGLDWSRGDKAKVTRYLRAVCHHQKVGNSSWYDQGFFPFELIKDKGPEALAMNTIELNKQLALAAPKGE